MKTILSHTSALEYWRLVGACKIPPPASSRAAFVDRKAIGGLRNQDSKALKSLTLSSPIHVLVDQSKKPGNPSQFIRHARSHELPARSLAKITADTYVVVPELCLLQMACQLDLYCLLLLAFELCGNYSVLSDEPTCYRGVSVTTPERIAAYASRAENMNGAKKLRSVSSFVLANSASPMESILAILLTLPYRLGGYGLEKPHLNYRIYPNRSAKDFTHQEFFSCDLYWPKVQVGVEYDSNLFHAGSEKIAKDSRRRDQLVGMNVTVFTMTAFQMLDLNRFEEAVIPLAKKLDRRLRLPEDFHSCQRRLHAALLPKKSL